ncbi:MAG TPA: CBS domain-containing protein [Candidatus Methanofastidiosa archaeon]|nr:CBS domain-containing protein [Candidatus Methanofastidiosa archaeon]
MEQKLTTSVKEFTTPNLLTIDGRESLIEAAKLMSSIEIGSLVVMEGEKHIGIITERDIIKAVANGVDLSSTPVDVIANGKVITIDAKKTVKDALMIMSKENIGHLPVVEKGRLIGMFSFKNFLDLERLRIGFI